MKNFIIWPNWLLLIFFIVIMCIAFGKDNYVSAYISGILAIFNMFAILVLYQYKIMYEQDEQKEREEKIIKMLKERKKT